MASKIGVLLKNGVLTKRLYGNISNIMEKPMQEVIKEHIMELNQISIYFSTFQIQIFLTSNLSSMGKIMFIKVESVNLGLHLMIMEIYTQWVEMKTVMLQVGGVGFLKLKKNLIIKTGSKYSLRILKATPIFMNHQECSHGKIRFFWLPEGN